MGCVSFFVASLFASAVTAKNDKKSMRKVANKMPWFLLKRYINASSKWQGKGGLVASLPLG
jgi:hypothetical protein